LLLRSDEVGRMMQAMSTRLEANIQQASRKRPTND
jgi:hypothetical protein